MRDTKSGRQDETMEDEDGESQAEDVFEMLKADHRKVEELFGKFEEADKREKTEIAAERKRGSIKANSPKKCATARNS